MRGTHSQLTITTATDEATGVEKPLFAFPVQICKATGSVDAKFDRATPDGSPYDTVYRDQLTGKIYDSGELIRGVRTGDSFATIPADQIEAIDAEVSMEDMRVERSVALSEVPFDRATGFYYLQAPPKGGSHTAYRLTYEALRPQAAKGKKKARPAQALQVKFTSRTRQKVGVVYADEQRECLAMVVLTFAAEVREPDEAVLAPQSAQVEAKQVEMARKVIEGLGAVEGVDFDSPEDEAIGKKRDLIAAAAEGKKIEVAPVPEAKVVEADELGSVLEASLQAA